MRQPKGSVLVHHVNGNTPLFTITPKNPGKISSSEIRQAILEHYKLNFDKVRVIIQKEGYVTEFIVKTDGREMGVLSWTFLSNYDLKSDINEQESISFEQMIEQMKEAAENAGGYFAKDDGGAVPTSLGYVVEIGIEDVLMVDSTYEDYQNLEFEDIENLYHSFLTK